MPQVDYADPFVRVRVVGDPGGDPPRWVREAWLGVEFDAVATSGKVLIGSARRRWWYRRRQSGWKVSADEAVAALLAAHRHDAAAWWRSSGLLGGVTILVFAAESCVLVDSQSAVPTTGAADD
jgi:hypothetical protein